MSGNDIPDTDNVVRYVGGSKLEGDVVLGEAFRLPSGDPTCDRLSINWLDHFERLSKEEQVFEGPVPHAAHSRPQRAVGRIERR